ncbi:MAG: hypothetical protein K2X02_09140 [Alphaproteobacteria bacterium]|nr:hypothetical protein [Alphaproteobacteria bacterium]
MRNKFLKVTFMALCLSTSSIVHAMIEEGDKGENRHAPVLFDGEYEIDGAAFLEPKYGSVTVCQFDKSILALRVNLNDSPGLWESNDPKVLQPLLKLNESDFPNNFVALHYNAEAVTPGVTSYYGKRTVDNCDILFEFRISDIPWKSHGEKGFNLWVRSILPVVSKIVVIPATEINSWKKTELNFGEDSLHVIPTIQFSLFKKANE